MGQKRDGLTFHHCLQSLPVSVAHHSSRSILHFSSDGKSEDVKDVLATASKHDTLTTSSTTATNRPTATEPAATNCLYKPAAGSATSQYCSPTGAPPGPRSLSAPSVDMNGEFSSLSSLGYGASTSLSRTLSSNMHNPA